jgi:ABC-2 type transport system permease protein
MTAIARSTGSETSASHPAGTDHLTWTGVVHSEWIKLYSLRSTLIVSALTLLVMVAFPVVLSSKATYNPIDESLFATHFAAYTISILGVLVVSGEYATRMIQVSLCAVPRRLLMFWAKAFVFAVTVFVFSFLAAVATVEAGGARYGSHGGSLASPGAMQAVFGAALFLTAMGLLGVGFGFLTRNTAGGITAVVAFTLLFSQGGDLLPASWQPHVVPYLPFQAGEAAFTIPPYPPYAKNLLQPWPGIAVLACYVAVVLAAAAIALRLRDAIPAVGWRDRIRALPGTGHRDHPGPDTVTEASAKPLSPITVRPVSLAGAIRAEQIKLRSVRSPAVMMALTAAIIIVTGLVAAATARWNTLSAAQRASFDPTGQSLLGAHNFAYLTVSVLGVLTISGEYSTGMIKATFCAVPRRLPVLWAKAAVLTPVIFVVTLVSSLTAFLAAQTMLGVHGVSLSSPGALRAVFGSALFLAVAGLFGLGIGFLTRNAAGGIAIVVGAHSVLQELGLLLPASLQSHIVPYLPLDAGQALLAMPPYGGGMLHPWAGFAVYCGYAAAATAAAAIALRRRDA